MRLATCARFGLVTALLATHIGCASGQECVHVVASPGLSGRAVGMDHDDNPGRLNEKPDAALLFVIAAAAMVMGAQALPALQHTGWRGYGVAPIHVYVSPYHAPTAY